MDNIDDKTAKRHLNMDAAPCYYKWMGLDGMGLFGWYVRGTVTEHHTMW